MNYAKDSTGNTVGSKAKKGGDNGGATPPIDEFRVAIDPESAVGDAIKIVERNIYAAVDETVRRLVRAGHPLYQKDGTVVMPIYEDKKIIHDDGSKSVVRSTRIVIMTVDKLRYYITKAKIEYERFVAKKGGGEWVPCGPTDKMLSTLLSPEHWEFKRLKGIGSFPTMEKDGTAIDKQGYDEDTETHYYWHPSLKLPIRPPSPTRDDAEEAAAVLLEPFSETACVSNLDWSVLLSNILAVGLRDALRHCPLYKYSAHMAGTGKSAVGDIMSNMFLALIARSLAPQMTLWSLIRNYPRC
jgi:hypothetical protein